LIFCPLHTGVLAVAVATAGVSLTVTATVPEAPVHPEVVTNTEYTPLASVEVAVMVGFCTVAL
jgi:hypothetical protein